MNSVSSSYQAFPVHNKVFLTNMPERKNVSFKSLKTAPQMVSKKYSIWDTVEKFLYKYINKMKNRAFSKDAKVKGIEQNLKSKGLNVRFNNNLELAKYIEAGVSMLELANVRIPKNILFMPSLISRLGIKGMTYKFSGHKIEESPIILPYDIYKKSTKENKLHTFFHETGHWLHFQNDFDIYKNTKIWSEYANPEMIEKSVSKRALALEDGSEFCAEVFAKQMAGIKIPTNMLKLAKMLNGYLIKN